MKCRSCSGLFSWSFFFVLYVYMKTCNSTSFVYTPCLYTPVRIINKDKQKY